MLKIYTYRQNNSGGSFHIDPSRGIGVHVYIEAIDANHANDIAENIGIYFNGVHDGMDCQCCGDRWSVADDSDIIDEIPEYSLGWFESYFHPYKGKFKKIEVKNDQR